MPKTRSNRNNNNNNKSINQESPSSPSPPSTTSPPSSPTPPLLQHTKLPSYLADAFSDLYTEDGLCVLGQGLGILHLLAAFCRFYVDTNEGHYALIRDEIYASAETPIGRDILRTKLGSGRPPTVFVIGLKAEERSTLISMLEKWGTSMEMLPMEVTNESGQGKDRAVLYERGGIFLITTRILIVDLLTHVASPTNIDGIMVAHAENVTDESTEAFILRIYRTQKRWSYNQQSSSSSSSAVVQSFHYGFVKAFSDAPNALAGGFARVDKTLKALYVRRLYLYPRFHESVVEELEGRYAPAVEELRQTLAPRVKNMQSAIAAAVQSCIREIKSATNLVEWSDIDLSLENCVTANFDLSVSRQLQHDWHRLKPSTKQLVHDLRTLRTLFQCLIQYDCISFWKLLESIKSVSAGARYPSLWLLTPAAERLFVNARERIYTIGLREEPSVTNPKPMKVLVPVLEENPKWRLLHQVLTEIEDGWKKKMKEDDDASKSRSRVLVMVKDERTLDTIQSYLVEGKDKMMSKRWLRYLKHGNDRLRRMAKNTGGNVSEESRLLLEEEGRLRNLLFGPGRADDAPPQQKAEKRKRKSQINVVPTWKRKKRRTVEERSRGKATMESEDDRERIGNLNEALEETERYDAAGFRNDASETLRSSNNDDVNNDDEDEYGGRYRAQELEGLRVVVHTYSNTEGERASLLLDDVRPDYVVMYDAEQSFVRSLEVYTACSNANIRVYFMLFEASAEEKNFVKSVEREQNAFEQLIKRKISMPLPVNTSGPWTTQEMQQAGPGAVSSYAGGTLPLAVDTRNAAQKRRVAVGERRDIAVDVREFRSSLPSILHRGGMRLAPVTLTVGDFVLSNVHCVERKSVSDLFGSFASGRLYTQAESMGKHYQCPCLLIEFDPEKTFCLQNAKEIGADIRTDGICSKMSLLVMHFPKLRLLWSRSPYETLKLFKTLKSNHEEVNVDVAMEKGSNESIDALLRADDEEGGANVDVNEAARDMLLRLPGITVHNARKVMKVCDSIADLAKMQREEMKELLGPVTGQKLFSFFHKKYDPKAC